MDLWKSFDQKQPLNKSWQPTSLVPINEANWQPKKLITFRGFTERYRTLKIKNKKATTVHGHENNIRVHYLPEFGDMQLSQISIESVQIFLNRKALEDKAVQTLKNLKWGLSAIFTTAIKYVFLTFESCLGRGSSSRANQGRRSAANVWAPELQVLPLKRRKSNPKLAAIGVNERFLFARHKGSANYLLSAGKVMRNALLQQVLAAIKAAVNE